MHCTKKITDDLIWVGANDRRLAMFEGVYSVPAGVSYNSYLLLDEKTVLFDTVDKAVRHRLMENISFALGGRKLDYLVVQHMEPDHSSGIMELLSRYPDMKIVCNAKTLGFIKQFYEVDAPPLPPPASTGGAIVDVPPASTGGAIVDFDSRVQVVAEGDTLCTGRHTLHFVMAPMVHWPEVMVTYDSTDKILFSADAFGCFGALNGALFADEVDFGRDYMDEARRYYTNIVGKYGNQVEALLKKASTLEINMICPLHGFVWRKEINTLVVKYLQWATYTPEETGVMIAYASVYGNTENTAEILSSRLRERGIKTVMYDVSVTPASDIVSAAFRWSHLVFASTTYNAGIFVTMEACVHDIVAHNIQNRTIAIIENGSWAATSGSLIKKQFEKCKNITFIEPILSLKSSLKKAQLQEIDQLVNKLVEAISPSETSRNSPPTPPQGGGQVDYQAMFKLSYGLFVLTAKDSTKDNGCIINTTAQLTDKPLRISITVNKANFTHNMIVKTKEFNVSIISESATFDVFKRFGFASGRDTDKFDEQTGIARTANSISYIPECSNAVLSGKVIETHDFGTHTLFVADVVEAIVLSGEPSATYQYYFNHIKPKPQPQVTAKKAWVCKICGYQYEGDPVPADFICPLCKHGADDFELV